MKRPLNFGDSGTKCYLCGDKGVRARRRAEMIPSEPDAVSTAEGIANILDRMTITITSYGGFIASKSSLPNI